MKTIAVIINGTRLPYHVIHYAINKAKESSSGIFALFLKGKHERSKGYGYPSDMHSTELSFFADEVVSEDESMITDNMELIKQMIGDEGIPYQSSLKTNASVDEVAGIIASAELVVMDKNFDDLTLMGDNEISLKAFRKKIDKPIDLVSDIS